MSKTPHSKAGSPIHESIKRHSKDIARLRKYSKEALILYIVHTRIYGVYWNHLDMFKRFHECHEYMRLAEVEEALAKQFTQAVKERCCAGRYTKRDRQIVTALARCRRRMKSLEPSMLKAAEKGAQ